MKLLEKKHDPFIQLTDIKIKSLKPQAKPYKVFDGQGLYPGNYPSGQQKVALSLLV
jgi:hypothetical protein